MDLLRACLASLRLTAEAGAQVIVVDNGSADNVAAIYAQFPFVTQVPRLDQNRQFAGGNNYGMQFCFGDYVLLLNNDTVGNPYFVGQLADYLDTHQAVGIVQGKMTQPRYGEDYLDVCGSFLTALGFPYHYGYCKPNSSKYQRPGPVFSGKGACLMLRRELVDKLGGFLFDEQFECSYEEADLCHRCWLSGYEVHFFPSVPIQHVGGATAEAKSNARFMLGHYLRNMGFSLMANLSGWSALRIMPLWFAVLALSTVGTAMAGRRQQFLAHCDVWAYLLRSLGKMRVRRELQRRIRKISDKQIFVKAMRTPRTNYWAATFLGDIGSYEDDPL